MERNHRQGLAFRYTLSILALLMPMRRWLLCGLPSGHLFAKSTSSGNQWVGAALVGVNWLQETQRNAKRCACDEPAPSK